ncbi:Bromodomain-containing protein [Fistulina hepatica ATCC 64428]|uniref:Bromodomain-containing protein n=1 Tax=Fistulina hepatica ATCC 64428 TaxID=1128425 RepID=A0A0D7AIJ0_9AGAR|nr:Bromodomain-containing protein [Fistulina hepatica ATCC 64428]
MSSDDFDGHAEHDGSDTPANATLYDKPRTNGVRSVSEENGEHDGPPPKRPRVHSDADQASIAHSATPPPVSATVSAPPTPAPATPSLPLHEDTLSHVPVVHHGPSTLSREQHRFALSTIRQLKRQKDSAPFLHPVDPVALNIPHYPTIIKHPMDFSTIERKLNSSNPSKLDPNPANPRYSSIEEFIGDVRLIVRNCITFNGPEHAVSLMVKRLEEMFDRQIKNMPASDPTKPIPVKKQQVAPQPPPAPVPVVKKPTPRRPSNAIPQIRRNDPEPSSTGRPKREIHPPPPKDLPYADLPKKRKTRKVKDNGQAEQLKFCSKLLSDLHRRQYYDIANPFYEPVDWVTLQIPSYPKVIKKPMDLSTIRKKLDSHEYPDASKFRDDFKLLIRNCFSFNPHGTPVNQAGIELQRVFDEKWKSLPPLRSGSEDEDDDADNESDEEEALRQQRIAEMESQIAQMQNNLNELRAKPPKKKKEKKERVHHIPRHQPVASTSKPPPQPKPPKPPKTSTSKKKSSGSSNKRRPLPDDDVLSFEQKKDLSEAIGNLDGTKLEKVIAIIHDGVPEIRDSTEEIELEIDSLPPVVLTKLYNFVLRPLRAPTGSKRGRPGGGKGTGTGGLKRKSMDEDVEAEKIRQLEERMRLFDEGSTPSASTHPPADRGIVDSASSDSDSGSDSSGSDSE